MGDCKMTEPTKSTGQGSDKKTDEIEGVLLELLDRRGWTVTGQAGQGEDLDLEVTFGSVPGRVRLCRPAPSDAKLRFMGTPTFIRVDFGASGASPERWGALNLTDDASEYSADVSDLTVSSGYQVAAGKDFVSVVLTTHNSRWNPWPKTIQALLSRAEALRPDQPPAAMFRDMNSGPIGRRGEGELGIRFQLFYILIALGISAVAWVARDWRGAPAVLMGFILLRLLISLSPAQKALSVNGHLTFGELGEPIPFDDRASALLRQMIQLVCLVLLGLCCIILVQIGRVQQWYLPAGVLLVGIVIVGIDNISYYRRLAKAFPFLQLFQSTEGLSRIRMGDERSFLTLPGIGTKGASVFIPGHLTIKVRTLSAQLATGSTLLTLSSWRIESSEGMPAASLVLPHRWITLSVGGKEAALERMPTVPRQHRHDGRAVWVISDTELEDGALENLVHTVVSKIPNIPNMPLQG